MRKVQCLVALLGALAGWLPWQEGGVAAQETPMVGGGPSVKSLVYVANRESNDVAVIDAGTDRIIKRFKVGARPHMTIVAGDGRAYTTGTDADDVTIFDPKTLTVVGQIAVGAKGPEHGTISPDGRWLYVANVEGNAVSAIDLNTHQVVRVIDGLSQPHNIVFTPDSRKAYIAQVGSYNLAVLGAASAGLVAQIPAGSPSRLAALRSQEVHGVNNAALIGKSGLLLAPNQDAGEVAIIDTRSEQVLKVIPVGREPWEPYATPDGSKIIVPNLGDRTVSIIGAEEKAVLATLPGGRGMTGVVVTPDSRKAYLVRRGDNRLTVIDLIRLKVKGEVVVGSAPEVATLIANGSKVYVANSGSNTVSVIDSQTDRVVRTIRGVGKYPWALSSVGGYNYCH